MSGHGAVVSGRNVYWERLIAEGSAIALPDLAHCDALHRVADRHGLSTVAVAEPALDEHQLEALARFRFAQYLAAGFVDEDVAWRERSEQCPAAAYTSPETVHFIVFAAATGLLLASLCMIGPPPAAPGTTIASRERPLFGVEEQFGWTPFNRLPAVAQAPVARVREYGRLVKNLRHPDGPRAVVELTLAAMRAGIERPLSAEFDIGIGHFEPNGVQRNLEFAHLPLVVLQGGLPTLPAGHLLNRGLEGRERHPFAFAAADARSARARLDAIEAALALPEAAAIRALGALKREPWTARSSLLPAGGIPALADLPLPQRTLSTAARRRLRAEARALARLRPFAELSESELTALRTLAKPVDVEAGTTLLAGGEVARELILIDEGAGGIVGAAGVLDGLPEPAAVVARTPLRTLRLSADVYATYLRELPGVESGLRAPRRGRLAASTAETQAALRAAGAADPRVRNPDRLAARFIGNRPRPLLLAKLPGARRLVPALAERLVPGSYAYENARTKHFDALLAGELRAGLEQLVLLGAGFDSRPYRFADVLRGVRVYEVDLPQLSALKRRKVARIPHDHVVFVAADFVVDDLAARLPGYDLGAPTLLIASGVLPFLPGLAVERLLAFAGAHRSPRSSFAFDYIWAGVAAEPLRERLAALGEPLRFELPAGAAGELVARFGLRVDTEVGPEELAARHLPPGLHPYPFSAIVHARL